jgi:hypothetical protein
MIDWLDKVVSSVANAEEKSRESLDATLDQTRVAGDGA